MKKKEKRGSDRRAKKRPKVKSNPMRHEQNFNKHGERKIMSEDKGGSGVTKEDRAVSGLLQRRDVYVVYMKIG